VVVPAGLAACVEGLAGYWGLAGVLEAVLLAKGFEFQNAELLLPLDWQPTRPNIAIVANAYRARWIPMAKASSWRLEFKKGGAGPLRPPCETEVI
jgi:hypothetical protein